MNNKRKQFVSQLAGGSVKDNEGRGDETLHACVSEFIEAVHSKDVEGAAQALKSCFLELDSSQEGEEQY